MSYKPIQMPSKFIDKPQQVHESYVPHLSRPMPKVAPHHGDQRDRAKKLTWWHDHVSAYRTPEIHSHSLSLGPWCFILQHQRLPPACWDSSTHRQHHFMLSTMPRSDSRTLVSKRWLQPLNQPEIQQGIHPWDLKLKETEDWDHLSPGGKYYFTRYQLTVTSGVCLIRWYVTQEPSGISGIHTPDSVETWNRNQCRCNSCGQPESQGASRSESTLISPHLVFRFVPFLSARNWDTCKLGLKRMEVVSGTPGWIVTFQLRVAWLSQKRPVLSSPN